MFSWPGKLLREFVAESYDATHPHQLIGQGLIQTSVATATYARDDAVGERNVTTRYRK